MPATIIESSVETTQQQTNRLAWLKQHWLVIAVGLAVLGLVIYAVVLAFNWPFTKQSVTNVLQEATLRTVRIGGFRKTFFPPGCVAERVQFERHLHKDKPPIISIQTLIIHGSYWGLLTLRSRLALVKVVNMQVTVPPAEVHGKPDPLMPLNHTPSSVRTLRIDKIVADGAVLDFAHEDGSKPYRITIDKLAIYNVSNNSVIPYKVILRNSVPPGTIRSAGVFGPWHPDIPANTPLHGTYEYENANLGVFKDISGIMQAHGAFDGNLGEIRTKGNVDVRNFHVNDTSHYRELTAAFQARVDGTNGNTTLDDVSAQFDHSSLAVRGTIAGHKGVKGKAIHLELISRSGRVEDILDLFIGAKMAPIMGALQMNGHLYVPPGQTEFLKRLRLWGDFSVENGRFTNAETQADLNRLSESAEKKNVPESGSERAALSTLSGHGDISNGVATLAGLTFQVPGATAQMRGTYGILPNYDIDLHGTLYTDGKPWTATTGFKSWMVRIITPFLKKKKDIRIVPFKITGNYHDTNIGLDLWSKRDKGPH